MSDDTEPATNVLVLFVHGLGGDPDETWRADDLPSLPERIERLAGVRVASYGYPTSPVRWNLFRAPPPDVQLLASGLRSELELYYRDIDHVVLACHSLGGLIARKALVERAQDDEPNPVRHLVLFATPNEGSDLARRGEWFSFRHRQLRQLMRDSEFLDELDRDWHQTELDDHVRVTVVYGALDRVVRAGSAQAHWGDFIVDQNAGHSSLVKPVDDGATCVRVLLDVIDGLDDVEVPDQPPEDASERAERVPRVVRTPGQAPPRTPPTPGTGGDAAQPGTGQNARADLKRFLAGALGGAVLLGLTLFGVLDQFGPDRSPTRLIVAGALGGFAVFTLLLPVLWWRAGNARWPGRSSAAIIVAGALLLVATIVVFQGGRIRPDCCPEPGDLVVAVSRLAASAPEVASFADELHDQVVDQLRESEFVGNVKVFVPDALLDGDSVGDWVAAQPFRVAVTLYGEVEPSSTRGERVTWALHSNSRAASSLVPLALTEQFGNPRILTSEQVRAGELGSAFSALVRTLEALEALAADSPSAARARVLEAQQAFVPEGGDESNLPDAQVPEVLWALDAFITLVLASQTLDRDRVGEVLARLGEGLRIDPYAAGPDAVDSPFAMATVLTARYLELFPATNNLDEVQPCPGTEEFEREGEQVQSLLGAVDAAALAELRVVIDDVVASDGAPVLTVAGLALQSRVRLLEALTTGGVGASAVLAPSETIVERFGDRPDLDLELWVADAHTFIGLIERDLGQTFEAIVSQRRAQAIATPFYEAQALADTGVILDCDLTDSPDAVELVSLAAACHFREATEIGTGLSSVDRDLRDAWDDRSADCTGDAASLTTCLLIRAAQRAATAGDEVEATRLTGLHDEYRSLVEGGVAPVLGWCNEVAPAPSTT